MHQAVQQLAAARGSTFIPLALLAAVLGGAIAVVKWVARGGGSGGGGARDAGSRSVQRGATGPDGGGQHGAHRGAG